MERQALLIDSWGKQFDANVYVKIPITNTKGESSIPLIRSLSTKGVKLNVTAITTLQQVINCVGALQPNVGAIVSVFCGRIADTGVDPLPLMYACRVVCDTVPGTELLWASPREVLNIKQADQCGCDIITVTGDLIKKMSLFGKDLDQYSLETVDMFYKDAQAAGFTI
jgi:transaldolase